MGEAAVIKKTVSCVMLVFLLLTSTTFSGTFEANNAVSSDFSNSFYKYNNNYVQKSSSDEYERCVPEGLGDRSK
jgi:surface polysaccharide O-acyltransferase-like enzyme